MTTQRPLIDRSRSSSRTRVPTLQSLSQPPSRSTSPIPSSPHLRSALKHHSPTASPLILPTDPPEPDSIYTRRVAFDTFESETLNKRAGGANFSISAKSRNYHRLGSSRTFLVCSDLNSYSWHAVEWTVENLLEDMDELVILRVIQPGTAAGKQFDGEDGVDDAREDADVLLAQVMAKDTDLQVRRTLSVVVQRRTDGIEQISIVVEFVVGDIPEATAKIIEVYRPDALITGSRGRKEKLFSLGGAESISRYLVAKSPIPTIVVRPDIMTASQAAKAGRQMTRPMTAPVGGYAEVETRGRPGRLTTEHRTHSSNELP